LTDRLLLLLLTKKREGPKNNARLSRGANRDTVVIIAHRVLHGARARCCDFWRARTCLHQNTTGQFARQGDLSKRQTARVA